MARAACITMHTETSASLNNESFQQAAATCPHLMQLRTSKAHPTGALKRRLAQEALLQQQNPIPSTSLVTLCPWQMNCMDMAAEG